MMDMESRVVNLINNQADGDKFIIVDQAMEFWSNSMSPNKRYDKAMEVIRSMTNKGILKIRNCDNVAYELNN